MSLRSPEFCLFLGRYHAHHYNEKMDADFGLLFRDFDKSNGGLATHRYLATGEEELRSPPTQNLALDKSELLPAAVLSEQDFTSSALSTGSALYNADWPATVFEIDSGGESLTSRVTELVSDGHLDFALDASSLMSPLSTYTNVDSPPDLSADGWTIDIEKLEALALSTEPTATGGQLRTARGKSVGDFQTTQKHVEYLERRRKNNIASKRSRSKSKQKMKEHESEIVVLREENASLRQQLLSMTEAFSKLQQRLLIDLGQGHDDEVD